MTDPRRSLQWERTANRRLTAHARQAVKAMRQVEDSALVWVDSVRQCVEDRMGIGPDDVRALADPVYNAALDRWSELCRLADQTELALQGLQGFPGNQVALTHVWRVSCSAAAGGRAVNRPGVRYVGTVQLPAEELLPIYASTAQHVCSAYCRGGRHTELLYREEPDALSRTLVQAVADLVTPGIQVLDVQPALEAPLPNGSRTAWLVTYRPPNHVRSALHSTVAR